MLGALVGVVRFWRAMKAADEAAGGYTPDAWESCPASSARCTPIFSHDKFGKCASHASRRLAHLGAFYGFAALFVVSVWAVIALYMINPLIPGMTATCTIRSPSGTRGRCSPIVGCVVLIAGCAHGDPRPDERAKRRRERARSFDWIFVWLLLAVGVTGLLTEMLAIRRRAGVGDARGLDGLIRAYAVYFVHLVVVFHLLVYLPYSKFAHIVYRTVALVYAEHSGRNEAEGGESTAAAKPQPLSAVGRIRLEMTGTHG